MDNAEILHLRQGSPEWHAHRKAHFNASDAAAALGMSPYESRTQLLDRLVSGIVPEIDAATQRRFDQGHEYEAMARPWAEEMLGEDLYPIVAAREVDGLPLSASYDGVTLDYGVVWEHKTLSQELAESLDAGEIPEQYCLQMEQQMLILGAQRALFTASAGDKDTARHVWYDSRPDVRTRLLAGWAQLHADRQTHRVAAPAAPRPEGRAPETLPALLIEVTGAVTASNLAEFKAAALQVFGGIKRDLQTDQDFADAEKAVKWCGEVEDRLAAAKQHALSQTASIDELFRAIDDISAEARRVRLDLDKLVTARKAAIRVEIVTEAITKFTAHTAALNERIGKPYMPQVATDFQGVIKGKKTLDSLRSAVDTELARAKIAANEVADRIQVNLTWLREHAAGKQTLFADIATLVLKDPEAMRAIAGQRISEHEQAEAKRLEDERARIRKEEEARAEAKLRAEQAAAAAAAAPPPPPPAPVTPAPVAAAPTTPPAVVAAPGAGREGLPASMLAPSEIPKPEPASIPLSAICARLGFTMTAAFVESQLGITATPVKSAKLYRPSDFNRICKALVTHVEHVAGEGLYE